MRITVITTYPQAVTDDGHGFVSLIFLLSKRASENGRDTKRRENTGYESCSVHSLRRGSPGEFIACVDESAGAGECFGGTRIYCDLTSSDGSTWVISKVISQQNEPVRSTERQRTQQHSLHEREDGGCRTNPKRQSQNDSEGKPG